MAPSATPAPGTCARIHRSTSIDLRPGGREPAAGLVLVAVLLLVLLGITWVDVARLSSDQDSADRTYRVLRGLDTVLAHLADAEAAQRGLLVTGQDDPPAPLVAGRGEVAGEIDTVAALTAGGAVQRQRIRQLRALVQQELTERRSTIGLRRSPGLRAVRAVVLRNRGGSGIDGIRSLIGVVQAEEKDLLVARRAEAASARRTIRTTLVVAGLLGLLLVAGAATGLGRSTTGPLHRAVAGPAPGRPDQRRRPAIEDHVGQAAPEAGVAPIGTEQVDTDERTVVDAEETGARPRDLVAVTTSVAQQTDLLALDAAIEAARAEAAGQGLGGVADGIEQLVRDVEVVARIPAPRTPAIAALVGVGGAPGAVAAGGRPADLRTGGATGTATLPPVRTTVFAAARSRAHGPTTALWHAVQLHRPSGAIDGSCEAAVCGSLVRVSTEQRWPVAARDVCPACATLAH